MNKINLLSPSTETYFIEENEELFIDNAVIFADHFVKKNQLPLFDKVFKDEYGNIFIEWSVSADQFKDQYFEELFKPQEGAIATNIQIIIGADGKKGFMKVDWYDAAANKDYWRLYSLDQLGIAI